MEKDIDPQETAEWLESLEAVRRAAGPERAEYLLKRLATSSRYINTVPTSEEPGYPGDLELEQRIAAYDRWNAAAMVTRGSRLGLGGHMATYASAAWLYEVGFNHFFHGKEADGQATSSLQGHASPGIYARAFLEGRLTEGQLDLFRREPSGDGLPSYPHPRRLPWLWEFPTVSMGLGPALRDLPGRFNRYLQQPRHQGHLASPRMGLPRRRRDGRAGVDGGARPGRPRGPGQPHLRDQLQPAAPRRAGARPTSRSCRSWRPSSAAPAGTSSRRCGAPAWDELLALDTTARWCRRLREVPDGQFQTYADRDAAYIREHFFGTDPALPYSR